MMLLVGRRAMGEGYKLRIILLKYTHHFMTCFVDPREGEVVDILNGSDSFSIDGHIRKRGAIDSFLSVPVH